MKIVVNQNIRYNGMDLIKGQVVEVDEGFPLELTKRVISHNKIKPPFEKAEVVVERIKEEKIKKEKEVKKK